MVWNVACYHMMCLLLMVGVGILVCLLSKWPDLPKVEARNTRLLGMKTDRLDPMKH